MSGGSRARSIEPPARRAGSLTRDNGRTPMTFCSQSNSAAIRQWLGNLARSVDEELSDGTKRSILQFDDSDRPRLNWEFDWFRAVEDLSV